MCVSLGYMFLIFAIPSAFFEFSYRGKAAISRKSVPFFKLFFKKIAGFNERFFCIYFRLGKTESSYERVCSDADVVREVLDRLTEFGLQGGELLFLREIEC